MPKKGYKQSKEHKEKISKNKKAMNFKYSEESKKKKSIAMMGKNQGKFTKEHKLKISIGKTGIKNTEEQKKRKSEAAMGHSYSEETKKKMSKTMKILCNTPEHKLKLRLAAIKRVKRNNNKFHPNFNKKACEIFKSFDGKYDTKGHYAPNEFHIKELGYWPDYINFEEKLIMEYDEKAHKYQQEKDKQRQKEIQKFYPDFEFKRIGEKYDNC